MDWNNLNIGTETKKNDAFQQEKGYEKVIEQNVVPVVLGCMSDLGEQST